MAGGPLLLSPSMRLEEREFALGLLDTIVRTDKAPKFGAFLSVVVT